MRQLSIFMYTITDLQKLLDQFGKTWNFDVFFLASLTDNKALSTLAISIMEKELLVSEVFNIPKEVYTNYFQLIE